MKGGKNEMFTIIKEVLSIDANNKGGYSESYEIKVSGMKQIMLDLAKKSSQKLVGCSPSMREVCTKCEGSGTQISESKIGDIENNEWAIGP